MVRKHGRPMQHVVALTLILLLTPLLAVARPQPAVAAGIVSQCTEAALRNALTGGGLVTFSCSGVIPIASQLVITADTTIDGGGQVTLDGQDATRLIQVNAGVTVELRGLTLTAGRAVFPEHGGAIHNSGTLTIIAGTLSGNHAETFEFNPSNGGAIFNLGSLTIIESIFDGNSASGSGGAIFNDSGAVAVEDSTLTANSSDNRAGAIFSRLGSLTLTASTLTGNRASFGGAVETQQSNATIIASTLSGNTAASTGGAIDNLGGSTMTIIASTLTGNSTVNGGGAISNGFSNLTLTASTLSGTTSVSTGGAIDNVGGTVTLTANILSSSVSNCARDTAFITSSGYNIGSDASCNLTASGDLQNTDPLLGPLANNGGPTATKLPLTGSPALNRVPNALCVILSAANAGRDQRGAPRPESSGAACDSGSVELQLNNYFCVGERSGSLRYFVTPNGCVRGEFRLMQTADGVYAFCVGDRSGSMRYLPNSATNCLRGEWQLVMPEVSPITICVGERSRAVRYVAHAGQCNARGELAYHIVNPVG